MKKHSRLSVLALALLTLSLSSCKMMVVRDLTHLQRPDQGEVVIPGEDDKQPSSDTNTTFTPFKVPNYDSQIEKYLAAIPKIDFEGTTVFITSPTLSYIDPDGLDSSMSREAYERNRALEERYNITLMSTAADANTMLTAVQNAVASGDYYTDLMMIPLYMTGHFKSANVLENLRSLPYLNLERPYFYHESVNALSAGYDTWAVAGDASVSPSDFSAVFFNKDLITATGLDMPYTLVDEKQWTWDAFYSYVSAVQDLNETIPVHKYYTVTAQNTASRLADLVYASCGGTLVLSGEYLIPSTSFTEETINDVLSYASKIFGDNRSITDSTAGAASCFAGGESLFLIDYTYVTSWLTNASANWGLVPMPTLSEGAETQTLVANTTSVFCVPRGTTNAELASLLLSSLNAASYRILHDAYVEHSMIYTLRDNASVNMLDMLLDTPVFDFALAFGTAYPNIGAGTYQLIRDTAKAGSIGADFNQRLEKANMLLAEHFPLS